MEKKYEIDMVNGPILKKMLLFTVPLICSSVLQLLFNAADIVVVGRYAGDNSLAAVGSNGSLINLMTNVFIGLSVGANVLAARDYGSGNEKELRKTVHTAMLLSLLCGVFLTILGVIFAPRLLLLMKAPANILPLAALYLRIYFLGMTAMMLYNFGSALLRSIGDTKRPLYYLIIAGVINVILNLFFVIQLQMDVAGVALATVISQFISAVLVIRCMMKEQGGIQLELSKLHIDKAKLWQIVRVGLPAGVQGSIFSLSNVAIQSSINLFGETVVAGNSAAMNLEGFVYVAMNSFYQAAVSFTSQNMGAGRRDRVPRILRTALVCVIVTGIVTGWTMYGFGKSLMSIYSGNPTVIDAGLGRMRVIMLTYFLCGIMDVIVGVLRGMGNSVTPMFVSLMGACGLRLIWLATVFQIPRFHQVGTVYLSYPITWIVTLTAQFVLYLYMRSKMRKS
ncbi:MAG: MATE family efflux transporter [bacterium]|nr:MATE family efflux transporter [bacterium]